MIESILCGKKSSFKPGVWLCLPNLFNYVFRVVRFAISGGRMLSKSLGTTADLFSRNDKHATRNIEDLLYALAPFTIAELAHNAT